MNPHRVTLTGLDPTTDLSLVETLSRQFPFAEWGILYSPSRTGGRYGPLPWVEATVEHLTARQVPVAVHFCGASVPTLLAPGADGHSRLLALASRAGRAQLNMPASTLEAPSSSATAAIGLLDRLTDITPRADIILQISKRTGAFCSIVAENAPKRFSYLVDASGGRGISPAWWPPGLADSPYGHSIGYAGGLGPDNIVSELGRIAAAHGPKGRWGVDMEGKLRDAFDAFSLQRCAMVLQCCAAIGGAS